MSTGSGASGKGTARPRALTDLRAALAACRAASEIDALVAELARDPRSGARELLVRIEARRLAGERERARLDGLLALRDSLGARGVKGIAGVDEVGVGPLAGPVVAAAVVLPARVELVGLDDSKRVPPARRVLLAQEIRATALGFGIGEVSVEEIDQLGIYRGPRSDAAGGLEPGPCPRRRSSARRRAQRARDRRAPDLDHQG